MCFEPGTSDLHFFFRCVLNLANCFIDTSPKYHIRYVCTVTIAILRTIRLNLLPTVTLIRFTLAILPLYVIPFRIWSLRSSSFWSSSFSSMRSRYRISLEAIASLNPFRASNGENILALRPLTTEVFSQSFYRAFGEVGTAIHQSE